MRDDRATAAATSKPGRMCNNKTPASLGALAAPFTTLALNPSNDYAELVHTYGNAACKRLTRQYITVLIGLKCVGALFFEKVKGVGVRCRCRCCRTLFRRFVISQAKRRVNINWLATTSRPNIPSVSLRCIFIESGGRAPVIYLKKLKSQIAQNARHTAPTATFLSFLLFCFLFPEMLSEKWLASLNRRRDCKVDMTALFRHSHRRYEGKQCSFYGKKRNALNAASV